MRICILMPSLDNGGVQDLILIICKGLRDFGHELTILAGDSSGKMREKFQIFSIIDLGKQRLRGDFKLLFSMRKIKKIFAEEKFDIVLAAPGFATAVAILTNSNRRVGKTAILLDDVTSLYKQSSIKHRISYCFYKHLYHKADAIIVAYDAIRDDLVKNLKIDSAKVKRVYYPIYNPSKSNPKKCSNIKGHKIAAAGRLVEPKDYPTLLEAVRIARKTLPDLTLKIAGEGPERQKLERWIRQNEAGGCVQLLGHINGIDGLLDDSNLFVLPSKKEAFGIVIVEALAHNLKVVSTDTKNGAQREILQNGRYGELCPVGNPEKMAVAIIKAFESEYTPGIQRAKDFDADHAINKYNKILSEIAK